MSWAKLDDQFHSHPKVENAGNAAVGVFARAMSYCAAYHTDGFVPVRWARKIGRKRDLDMLVEHGLWLRVEKGETYLVTGRRDSGRRPLDDVTVIIREDGYFIDEFLHFHLTRAELNHRNERLAEAGRKGGQAKAKANPVAKAAATLPDPTRPVLRSVDEDPVLKLLAALKDRDDGTERKIRTLTIRYRLSEGDLMWARECAAGPGVVSPTGVALAELRKRGLAKEVA